MSRKPDPLRNLEILFEDESLLVVSKPAGMAVHSGAGEDEINVIDLFRSARGDAAPLHLAHRLDKGTSGVLVLAKSTHVAASLGRRWEESQKNYWAVVLGVIEGPLSLRTPLEGRDGRQLSARTDLEPLGHLESVAPISTVVRATIGTGRLHQIRRHLASKGHPVLMDRQYGDFDANREWSSGVRALAGLKPKHPMLHAHRILLPHPRPPHAMLEIRAGCPDVWLRILKACGAETDLLERLPKRSAI